MGVYICIYVCTHTHAHTHIHIHADIHVHTYMHTCIHNTYTCIYIYIHVHTNITHVQLNITPATGADVALEGLRGASFVGDGGSSASTEAGRLCNV